MIEEELGSRPVDARSPSSTRSRSPPLRSARSTAPGSTTAATSRSRSSTRASTTPFAPTCRTSGCCCAWRRRITPQLDVKALAEEIRDRIVDELDYELEAAEPAHAGARSTAATRSSSCRRGHLDVPRARDRHRVRRGRRLRAARATSPQEERNRIGEIIFRFYFGSMYRHRRFSGDPHPGNMLRLADGRIAFLDFGLFKELGPQSVELELACQRARPCEGDAEELHRLLADERLPPRAREAAARRAARLRASTRSAGTRPTTRSS